METVLRIILTGLFLACAGGEVFAQSKKQEIKALYIPLADHYAGLIAYEKYRDGNALAINDLLNADVGLAKKRFDRKQRVSYFVE